MSIERGKIVKPFLAHGDPSTTVVPPFSMIGVGASAFRVCPCFIFYGVPHTMGASVRAFVAKTAARGRKSAPHVRTKKGFLSAAIALAKIYTAALMCQNKQSVKTFPGYVNQWRHNYIQLSHTPVVGNSGV